MNDQLQNEALTFEKVWLMFQETDKRFKETDNEIKETRKILDEKFKDTANRINEMIGHFDKQFGKLVEALVRKNTLNLFRDKQIQVTRTSANPSREFEGKTMEFDFFLLNKVEMVVIEAKTTLNKQKVYKFLKKLENFKLFFDEYSEYKVFAALAYITADQDSIEFAEENGLFLLKPKDEDYMEFANNEGFSPKIY